MHPGPPLCGNPDIVMKQCFDSYYRLPLTCLEVPVATGATSYSNGFLPGANKHSA